jgi:hypothetical protein
MKNGSNWVPEETGGKRTLEIHSGDGWYVSLEKYDNASAARTAAQLPPQSSARYRLEFEVSDVKDNLKVPNGLQNQAEHFEPLARDFESFGTGGASQLLIDGIEVPLKSVWDISGPSPVKVWPIP